MMPTEPTPLVARVDHLVYASPDLDRGVETLERMLGVRASPGGRHPGGGTRNALLALGPTSYLEIIAPDPAQPTPARPRSFGLDTLREPRLVAWAANASDLDRLAGDAKRQGIDLGEVAPGSRVRPDGVALSWRLTTGASAGPTDDVVPFFIDWGQSPHPARTAAPGLALIDLRAEHPNADSMRTVLRRLGLEMAVEHGAQPALVAIVDGPRGRVELR